MPFSSLFLETDRNTDRGDKNDKFLLISFGAFKMKILAAGDIHGDTSAAEMLAKKAEKENVDLVVLCGDLTIGETSTKGLLKPFVEKGQKVVLIPGNHETIATAEFLAKVYSAINLHGYSISVKDVGLFGCGGANVGVAGISVPMTDSEIYGLLKRGFEQIKEKKKKVMVTHVHPDKTLMGKMGVFPGSAAVKRAIENFKPSIAICSHVHEAEGIEETIGNTKVFCVGKRGKVIEV